jgi:hypothetical protein
MVDALLLILLEVRFEHNTDRIKLQIYSQTEGFIQIMQQQQYTKRFVSVIN